MRFVLENVNENPIGLARKIGYKPIGQNESEYSMVKPAGFGNYPRFHIYLKPEGRGFVFNLHLDQKKESYKGSHAHSGDYDGDVLEREMERIKGILE